MMLISSMMLAGSIDHLIAQGCDAKLEDMARAFLRENSVLLSIYEDRSETGRKLDLSSLELAASFDLDPGSWNLRRETSFRTKEGDVVSLYTFGNLYCDDERVLGIKGIEMRDAAQ